MDGGWEAMRVSWREEVGSSVGQSSQIFVSCGKVRTETRDKLGSRLCEAGGVPGTRSQTTEYAMWAARGETRAIGKSDLKPKSETQSASLGGNTPRTAEIAEMCYSGYHDEAHIHDGTYITTPSSAENHIEIYPAYESVVYI